MAQSVLANDVTPGDYGQLLRRRWRAVATGLLVGLLLAVAYLHYATPTYVAAAKVLVRSVATDTEAVGARTADLVNLDTEAQLVTSFSVADLAADRLDFSDDPVLLTQHVSVTVPANTTVLNIAYADSSKEAARKGAQAFATAYLENRTSAVKQLTADEIDLTKGIIFRLDQQLRSVDEELNDPVDPPTGTDRTGLLAQRDSLNSQVGAASVQLTTLQATVKTGGRIIFAAQTPNSKTAPNSLLVIPSGLMAGFLLGIALAFWRDRMDKRVHTATSFEHKFGTPVLADVDASRAVSLARSPTVQHEMRRVLQELRNPDAAAPFIMLVVSPSNETTDGVVGVLAGAAARSGASTTLVRREPANGESPPALTAAPGWDLEEVHYRSLGVTDEDGLLVGTDASFLARLREGQEVVVVGLHDDPRALGLPALGQGVDVVVLVVVLGETRRPDVDRILGELAHNYPTTQVVAVTLRPPQARRGRDKQVTRKVPDSTGSTVLTPRMAIRSRRDRPTTEKVRDPFGGRQ